LYVIKIKNTCKYWKSHASEVELHYAKISKNKSSAEQILKFYDNVELEVLEVEHIIKLKQPKKIN
jgi:hypothetical protein